MEKTGLMKTVFDEIDKARVALELGEYASLEQVKSQYFGGGSGWD